jgi:hypothetical protein
MEAPVTEARSCPRCGALWLGEQLYWSGTGRKASELDLAGLVCNMVNDPVCINPCKGREGGDTWAKRVEFVSQLFSAEA